MLQHVAAVAWLALWLGHSPQVASQGPERLVQESVEAIAARARQWNGSLPDATADAFRRWLLAARSWQDQTRQSPESLLAEGVLFDCLSRMAQVQTGFGTGIAVDRRWQDLGKANPQGRAKGLFDKALKAGSHLTEARFRAARIHGAWEEVANNELVRLAQSSESEFAYLAAVTLGSLAHRNGDESAAERWYGRALALRPSSVAAQVGLLAITPGLPGAGMVSHYDDPYYDYPCRVMSHEVNAELQKRMAEVRLR